MMIIDWWGWLFVWSHGRGLSFLVSVAGRIWWLKTRPWERRENKKAP
ncbi:MAG: hypothetical protein KDD89_13665 [Anaerolineales bacterium]|nr:hypothetical protein [Anaerolineales bacterium]